MFESLSTILLLTSLFQAVGADEYRLGDLLIDHPWSRELPAVSKNGAAYFRVENKGAKSDRILSASSPIAARSGLHTHEMEGGIMKMRQVASVEVPASGGVSFEPGGLHVMLLGLDRPLIAGESYPLTLTFERAGEIEMTVMVEPSEGVDHHEHTEE